MPFRSCLVTLRGAYCGVASKKEVPCFPGVLLDAMPAAYDTLLVVS